MDCNPLLAACYNQGMEKKAFTFWEFIKVSPLLLLAWTGGWVLTISDLFTNIFRRHANR